MNLILVAAMLLHSCNSYLKYSMSENGMVWDKPNSNQTHVDYILRHSSLAVLLIYDTKCDFDITKKPPVDDPDC